MDPVARERLWAVLEHLKSKGHTIIFTSFHTQECLHLATKLVIIAEGNVQCLGSPKAIQQRYARGYSITFRIRNDVLTPIDIVSATMGRVVEFKRAVEASFLYEYH
jgi:ABC-type multidrug transport system ATPase subunit